MPVLDRSEKKKDRRLRSFREKLRHFGANRPLMLFDGTKVVKFPPPHKFGGNKVDCEDVMGYKRDKTEDSAVAVAALRMACSCLPRAVPCTGAAAEGLSNVSVLRERIGRGGEFAGACRGMPRSCGIDVAAGTQ